MQPPGYVTQMYSRGHRPRLVECSVKQDDAATGEATIDCNAKLSDDGKSLTLSIVSTAAEPQTLDIRLAGFEPTSSSAEVVELRGELDATNTASDPQRVVPTVREWKHGLTENASTIVIAPFSVTTIAFE
jgi:alpha-L-arabinofuranosidase